MAVEAILWDTSMFGKKKNKKQPKKKTAQPNKKIAASNPNNNSTERTMQREQPKMVTDKRAMELDNAVENFKKVLEEKKSKEALKNKVSDFNQTYGRRW